MVGGSWELGKLRMGEGETYGDGLGEGADEEGGYFQGDARHLQRRIATRSGKLEFAFTAFLLLIKLRLQRVRSWCRCAHKDRTGHITVLLVSVARINKSPLLAALRSFTGPTIGNSVVCKH